MNITIKKSSFYGFGTKITENGIYFGCTLSFLTSGGIRIYDAATKKLIKDINLTEEYACGDVYCFTIEGIDYDNILYRFYCDKEEFADIYSVSLVGNENFGEEINEDDIFSQISSFNLNEYMENDRSPKLAFCDSILYLCHVRGETMLDRSVKNNGSFNALKAKIPYFMDLGITTLEVMPCYEYIECLKSTKTVKKDYKSDANASLPINYWGFCDSFYFSPKKGFASTDNASKEFADLIIELHKNNMELIMMMYYPEGTSSDIITDSLRFYVTNYHVDGFRIMGTAPDIRHITADPFLKNSKLIFENIDAYALSMEKTKKYKNIAILKNDFEDKARAFLKGDEDKVGFMSFAVRENNRAYSPVRFLTDYNGFTLNDLVSYSRKHNEDNGEDNTDGTNYNFSWNCGFEGETKKASVNKLRLCQAKNAMLLMLLSQGVPQILAGDEVLNSAKGNNNPWCQDNSVAWVEYAKTKLSKEFYSFTKNLLAFRKRHVILHQPYDLKLFDYMSCKLPDVSFHGEDAYKMNQDPVSREFAVLYAGDYSKQYTGIAEDSVYIAYNMHWEEREFALPINEKGAKWYKLFSSDGSTDNSFDENKAEEYSKDTYMAKGRSITIFLLRR